MILSNLAKIIKNRKGLPRSRDRVAPGIVEGDGGAAVVGEEVARILGGAVALDGYIVDGHGGDGAGAVAGREGDVGVPLCGRGEGEDGEVFAALADIVRGA